jgi:hypothetical protein
MNQKKIKERRKRELTNVPEYMAPEIFTTTSGLSLVFVLIWFHALSTLLQNL